MWSKVSHSTMIDLTFTQGKMKVLSLCFVIHHLTVPVKYPIQQYNLF